MPRGKTYTPEFKEQAAKRVIENSLPVSQVARELGINDTTLGFWVKDYRKKVAGQPLPAEMPDQERIRELERRNRELEQENASWRSSGSGSRWAALASAMTTRLQNPSMVR